MAQRGTEDESKLPKWAQARLTRLKRDLGEAERARATAEARLDVYLNREHGDVDGTANTYLVRYGSRGHDDIPLGRDGHIRFVVERYPEGSPGSGGPWRYFDVRLDEARDGTPRLYVSCERSLLISPSSNSVHVLRDDS